MSSLPAFAEEQAEEPHEEQPESRRDEHHHPGSKVLRGTGAGLRVRWLGTVPFREAWSLQQVLNQDVNASGEDRLLLLEHPPTFTLGRHADQSHVLVDPAINGAELIDVDRGGDVTFHGPGQLVAYPILTLPTKGDIGGGLPDTPGYVCFLEQVLIDTLRCLGLDEVGRQVGRPGVWIEPDTERARKVAAVGVRIEHGRSLHGVALNVSTNLDWFDQIVPCGIADKGVTSLSAEGLGVGMPDVVGAFVDSFERRWEPGWVERSDVVWRHLDTDLAPFSRGAGPGTRSTGSNRQVGDAGDSAPSIGDEASGVQSDGTSIRLLGRLAQAGVTRGKPLAGRKPDWMRAPVRHSAGVLELKQTVRDLGLTTVCEEAGCPNLSECWSHGTATFMVCGERCTRACGFCLVDTRHPERLDPGEPARVAEAVRRMDVSFAVVTMVARDDLSDGGAGHVAETVAAIRAVRPGTSVEVLISDLKGDETSLARVLDASPDVVNHNIETVARLQRAVRPSAGYARSLGVLARSHQAGATVKSGLVLGMGETEAEVLATLADLAAVGTSIVTIGQYLRPTSHHLPVARWWRPDEFEKLKIAGEGMGIAHVESSPFTRSSYHARESAASAAQASGGQAAAAQASGRPVCSGTGGSGPVKR